jgi:uncharacterized membrane protein YadS
MWLFFHVTFASSILAQWWRALAKYVPVFIWGFVGASVLRSLGDTTLRTDGRALYVLDARQWKTAVDFVGNTLGSQVLLGTAMAGVGLSTDMAVLKGVGWRPFVVGGLGSIAMGATAVVLARHFAPAHGAALPSRSPTL